MTEGPTASPRFGTGIGIVGNDDAFEISFVNAEES